MCFVLFCFVVCLWRLRAVFGTVAVDVDLQRTIALYPIYLSMLCC